MNEEMRVVARQGRQAGTRTRSLLEDAELVATAPANAVARRT